MILLICEILKKKTHKNPTNQPTNQTNKNPKLMDTENRLVVARGQGVGTWVKGAKKYKLPAVK